MDSTIELTDIKLRTKIGNYGPDDIIPSAHLLDLKLSIDPVLVVIKADGMDHVFDYDPLVAEINRLACDGHYETQERLITRIVGACAAQPEITALEIYLRKTPVIDTSGSFGVRLVIKAEHLDQLR